MFYSAGLLLSVPFYLSSTDVPEHATKLQRLSQIHIREQVRWEKLAVVVIRLIARLLSLSSDSTLESFQDQMEAQSQEVKKLFEEYNKMVHICFCRIILKEENRKYITK